MRYFFFFFFLFCRAILLAYRSSQPTPQPQQHRTQAMSATYTTVHSNARSLTHWTRTGTEPVSSWMLIGFSTAEAIHFHLQNREQAVFVLCAMCSLPMGLTHSYSTWHISSSVKCKMYWSIELNKCRFGGIFITWSQGHSFYRRLWGLHHFHCTVLYSQGDQWPSQRHQQDLCLALPFFFFPLFRATLVAFGSPQARGRNQRYGCQPQPQQCWNRTASVTYTRAHVNARSPTHWAKPGVKPTSWWTLAGWVSDAPQQDLPKIILCGMSLLLF